MLGGLIGAGASLLGGILGNKSAKKADEANYQRQKEFAKNGISWKVEDAKRAGIAPLAALGSNLISYSPQSIGGGGDYGISAAGQDISRAIDAGRSPGQRVDAYTRTAQALELERGSLQNDLLRSQIAKLNQPGHTNGIAVDDEGYTIAGQPNSGIPGVQVQPSKTTVVTPHVPHEQRGTVPDLMWAQTSSGGYAPVPSAPVKNLIEDQLLPEFGWAMRNMVKPTISNQYSPPTHVPLKPGYEWYYDVWNQEYNQRRKK